jgi:hypothetical protein
MEALRRCTTTLFKVEACAWKALLFPSHTTFPRVFPVVRLVVEASSHQAQMADVVAEDTPT